MRNLAFVFILCLAVACEQDAEPNTTTPVAPENAVNAPDNSQLGNVATPVAPDPSVREVQALLNGWWVIEHWIDMNDPASKQRMRGHWLKFMDDGTFTSGYWQEQTAAGVWAVTIDGGRRLLTLDSNDDREDRQFDMQGITSGGDAMSWVGTKDFKMANIMSRVEQLGSRPTKAQYGVE